MSTSPPDPDRPRSVDVRVTYRLEVTDLAALQAAVEAAEGPARNDPDRRLRQVPANLVGLLLGAGPAMPELPGVVLRASGLSPS